MNLPRRALLVLLTGIAFVALAPFAPAKPDGAAVQVRDGWIRSLPGDLPAAGYMTIVNPTSEAVVLVGVSSADYARAQLHQSYTTAEGYARMREINRLTIPAHGQVSFSPGGYHLMLMDARKPLQPGDTAAVELHFEGGAVAKVSLLVRPASYGG